MKFLNKFAIILFISLFLNSCGGGFKLPKPGDARNIPSDGRERARKNIEEGRGVSAGDLFGGKKGTNYEFSTSNPMWRATLDILDFLPLTTVDYSGGVIISDWYTDDSDKDQALKVTVRFLSNQVRANSLKVTVHRKRCSVNQSCKVELFKSRIQQELIASILREAAILEKQKKE